MCEYPIFRNGLSLFDAKGKHIKNIDVETTDRNYQTVVSGEQND